MPTVALSFGSTPRRTDGQWQRWYRILRKVQDSTGGSAENEPQHTDTIRTLKLKVLRAYNLTI